MTPREALDVLRRLDVAVAKAFSGAQFDASYAHPTIAGRGGWIVPILRWDELGLAASSARPALKTLAECVVVSRETMQMLVEVAEERAEELEEQVNEDNYDPETGTIDEDSAIAQQSAAALRAAIAEAEEAMR